MKLDLDFPELETARRQMGAQESGWRVGGSTLDPREQLLANLASGIEIKLSDVETGPGQLLSYKSEQVLLYIRDTQKSEDILENQVESAPRFHVAECQTLARMRREGRFERYVVTNRMDGEFLVDWMDPVSRNKGETKARLMVCKNCLEVLDWRGYRNPKHRFPMADGYRQTKEDIWRSFSIPDFLMEYSTFFHAKPSRRDVDAKINNYVDDWPEISARLRRNANWICQDCGVNLQAEPRLLHCHHKSGDVTDNSISNIAVLCIIDHSKQPGHNHMKPRDTDRRTIERLRAEQGII